MTSINLACVLLVDGPVFEGELQPTHARLTRLSDVDAPQRWNIEISLECIRVITLAALSNAELRQLLSRRILKVIKGTFCRGFNLFLHLIV